MTVVTIKPRSRLSLKPHERRRALELGRLQDRAPEPPKVEVVPGPRPKPDRPATGREQALPRLPRPLAILAAAFGVETIKVPLAIGAGKVLTPEQQRSLRKVFRSATYVKAVATSPHRYNLDGTVGGPVDEKDRAGALAVLAHYAEQSAIKAQMRKKEE